MKSFKIYQALLILLVVISGLTCKNDDDPFVLRDTDALTFDYAASSQTFTVRTNGAWTVSNGGSDWITLSPGSGTGDGDRYEKVTVAVALNGGRDRDGKIAINAAGKEIYINVHQKIGPVATFGAPAITGGVLQQNVDISGVNLSIPYSGAMGDEQFTVSVAVSGAAATGINPVSNYPVTLSGKSGRFEVPLSGKPSANGTATLAISTSYTTIHPDVKIPGIDAVVYPPLNVVLGTPAFSSLNVLTATRRISGLTLDIPYSQGEEGIRFTVSVGVTGVSGIIGVTDYPVEITASTGTISIPITGIPYMAGEAVFDIIYPGQPLGHPVLQVISDGKKYYPGTILVTGAMTDPRGNDCNTSMSVVWYNPNENTNMHGDGYEYVQLMAVEDIDFSATPYSVVICKNTNVQTPTAKGWAEGGNRTYKFNLTEGAVSRGEFFYIGGKAGALNGYSSNAGNTTASSYDGSVKDKVWTGHPIEIPAWASQNGGTAQTTGGIISIKDAKWIRTKAYITEAGDGFGNATGGNNSNLLSNSPNPGTTFPGAFGVDGIAVYEGTEVDENTVPMDLIFFGQSSTGAANYTANGIGYTVPLNDLYSPVDLSNGSSQPYFGQGGNTTFLLGGQPELTMGIPCSLASGVANGRDCSAFIKFAGELGADNSWIKPREPKTVYLLEPKNYLEQYGLNRPAQLSDIETDLTAAGTNGPVMIVH
ncbi:MAG: BACON domain-containing protein [Bacteroidales bacterium]|nr:BACON domain-containing protein [Bacteroidales bacterium]